MAATKKTKTATAKKSPAKSAPVKPQKKGVLTNGKTKPKSKTKPLTEEQSLALAFTHVAQAGSILAGLIAHDTNVSRGISYVHNPFTTQHCQ
jgi:hypothetical protein